MKKHPTILALGWESWQSPPQCSLAELLAVLARDQTVAWVDPQPEWSELSLRDYLRRLTRPPAVRLTPEKVRVFESPPLPPIGFRFLPACWRTRWTLAVMRCAKWAWGLWLRHALAREGLRPDLLIVTEPFDLSLAGRLGERLAVYYVYDETSMVAGMAAFREALQRAEERGMPRAALVFTSSMAQHARRVGQHPRVIPLLNAISAERFACRGAVPPDLAFIPRPRLLVCGQVDFRLDAQLLAELAERRADWSIVLLGRIRATGRSAHDRLRRFPNIHFLGHRDPSQLGNYQAACNIGLIPFVIGEATRAMRPLRLLGYFASGLPVVSVPLPELETYRAMAHDACTAAEFEHAIVQFLASDNAALRTARQMIARAETWEARAATFLDAVRQPAPRPPSGIDEARSEKRCAA